jgi:hypothetical protein
MLVVAESFLKSLIKTYGKHTVYSDGRDGTWYPEACSSLGLKHRLHITFCLRKSSLKELYNISRIRRNDLMIAIFHAGKSYVTSHMYTNG